MSLSHTHILSVMFIAIALVLFTAALVHAMYNTAKCDTCGCETFDENFICDDCKQDFIDQMFI